MKLALKKEQKTNGMGKLSIFLIALASVSSSSFGQLLEIVRKVQDTHGDIQVAIELNRKYGNEMLRMSRKDLQEERKKMTKALKEGEDYAEFAKNAQAISEILRSVEALVCMLEQYRNILSRNRQYGYTCYQDIKLQMYTQEMSAIILSLRSVFNRTSTHVQSIDRNLQVLKEADRTADVANDLDEEIQYEKSKERIFMQMQREKDREIESFASSYYADIRGYKASSNNKNQ